VANRLRVAIDARYWRSSFQTGVERYILLLLEALHTVSEHVGVAVVVRADEQAAFTASAHPSVRVLTVPTKHHRALRTALADFNPHLVHYPFDLPPEFDRPAVYTLHDPGRYLYPELMVRRIRDADSDKLRDQLYNPNLRAVITVSHASRADIVRVFGDLPQPLRIVPNFVATDFAADLAHARATFTAPQIPFILAVGVYIPTKNTTRLIAAFRQARAIAPEVVPPLLQLVGRLGWDKGVPRNGAADVRVLGHISNEQLAQLYTTCANFAWPSFYEGFGIPILEALTAGSKVWCSDLDVHREVAGDLALFTDPHDTGAMAKTIINRCRLPGPDPHEIERHLAQYTAAAAGAALLDTYQTAVSATHP
jgi:glycosyltransferase involved in cell wall biosynthesis